MITNKSEVKFVPLGLKYDQNIQNHLALYSSLLQEQNVYLSNYADFRIGGLMDNAIDFVISGETVKENILASQYAVDIHWTAFMDEKGIWTVETTKENIHNAMHEVDIGLEALQNVLTGLAFYKKSSVSSSKVDPNIWRIYGIH